MEQKGTWSMRWGFLQKISVQFELREVKGCVVENLNTPQIGYVLRIFLGNSEMDPDLEI